MMLYQKIQIRNNLQTSRGFLTIMSALIVATIGLSISTSLILLGLGTSRTSLSLQQSYQASSLADACIEEALQQISDSMLMPDPVPDPLPVLVAYTGKQSISLGSGSCSYVVTSTGVDSRKITALGLVGTSTRKVQVLVGTASPISISFWQEVSDFN